MSSNTILTHTSAYSNEFPMNRFQNRDEYPRIERNGYIEHPRNPSFIHNLSDPVLVHVNTAEVMIRRGFRSHPDFPIIDNIIELNYIENKTLQDQFEVKPKWTNLEVASSVHMAIFFAGKKD